MAIKARKDKKGYALRTGEYQRADGRYSYSWTDNLGVRRIIYARTLVDLRTKGDGSHQGYRTSEC